MKNNYQKAAYELLNGKVVGFATETVMGLGVVYNNKAAYELLNRVKRRPENKPYSLMIGDVDDIDKYAYISKDAQKLIDAFLPGSITILLPVKDSVPTWVTHGGNTIGIRVPSNEVALELLKEVKLPLLVPSANRSGEKPCMTSKEVKDVFENEVAFVLEGNAEGGLPSTLIDMTKEIYKILREGPITKEMIDEVLKGARL